MPRVILRMMVGLSLCITPVAQAGIFDQVFGSSLTPEEKVQMRGGELARDAVNKTKSKDYRGAITLINKAIELDSKQSVYYLLRGES